MLKSNKKSSIVSTNTQNSAACFLCDTINIFHKKHLVSSALNSIGQWDVGKSSQTRSVDTFKCFVCDYVTKSFNSWKEHVMSKKHTFKCHNITNLCSYYCGTCKILFYGSKILINQHRNNIHHDNSNLPCVSILMAELMKQVNAHLKDLYSCSTCKKLNENPCLHFNKKYKSKIYYCKYCHVSFFSNINELDCHLLSVEHLTLKCIYLLKDTIQLNYLEEFKDATSHTKNILYPSSTPLKLSLIILNRFLNISPFMTKCKFCNVFVNWDINTIVGHVLVCTNKGYLTLNMHNTSIKTYDCEVCNYRTQSFSDYKLHVISLNHLINCHTIDNLYSYFCTICNLYMYSSKSFIQNHWKTNHNKTMTEIPLLSNVLADNFKFISNNPESEFIDYFCDKQFKEDIDFPLIKCYACKINFCKSFNDYNLHTISSEHIVLKYFTSKNPSSNTENYNGTSKQNINPIINNKAMNQKHNSSVENIKSTDHKEIQVDKDYMKNKSHGQNVQHSNKNILKNNESIKNYDDGSKQQNTCCINSYIDNQKKSYYNTTTGVSFSNIIQSTVSYADVSTCTDLDLRDKQKTVGNINIGYIQSPLNSRPITENNEPLINISKLSDIDVEYGQYVTQRLENIHNISIKREIKREIDFLFYSKIIQSTKETIKKD